MLAAQIFPAVSNKANEEGGRGSLHVLCSPSKEQDCNGLVITHPPKTPNTTHSLSSRQRVAVRCLGVGELVLAASKGLPLVVPNDGGDWVPPCVAGEHEVLALGDVQSRGLVDNGDRCATKP